MYQAFSRILATAGVVVALAASPANAQTVTYTSKSLGAGVSPVTVTKTDSTSTTVTAFVGEIILQGVSTNPIGSLPGLDAGTTTLRAWCIDLFGVLQGSWTYTAGSVTTSQATLINALITGGSGADHVFNNTEAAATQLAIWKAIYGAANITSNNTTLNTTATTYFNNATTAQNGFVADSSKYVLGLLENPDTAAQQQLVTLLPTGTPGGGGQSVPEPASLVLMSIGLIGIGIARRQAKH